jgi:hypothetical protein
MSKPIRPILVSVVLACTSVLLGTPCRSMAQDEHAHMHDQAGAAVANMTLDGDRKWATDEALRSGMAAIRKAFDTDHPAIHAATETDSQYAALADRIEAEVKTIVANCRLPPAADANLHYVIADLMQGATLMRGQTPGKTRHDGAARVHGALNAYAKYFDDSSAPETDHPPK